MKDLQMTRSHWIRRALLAAVTVSALGFAAESQPAAAAVACKTAGVPKGCVAAAPATTAPGVGTAGAGAAGPGVAPGRAGNRGGPVNRVGRQ
jgi:hypothetical protein